MFSSEKTRLRLSSKGKHKIEPRLVEMDYGEYEGLKTSEIRALRGKGGLNAEDWDQFKDGCEGGESPEEVTQRVDALIAKFRGHHRPNRYGEKASHVVLVSHQLPSVPRLVLTSMSD